MDGYMDPSPSASSGFGISETRGMNVNFRTVQYAESANITTITLNRPDKRNAISYELIDDLIAALHQAANASPSIVILTGAGSALCPRMDLHNLNHLTAPSTHPHLTTPNP